VVSWFGRRPLAIDRRSERLGDLTNTMVAIGSRRLPSSYLTAVQPTRAASCSSKGATPTYTRSMEDPATSTDEPHAGEERIRGPHLWLNWQAMRAGQPARTASRSEHSVIIAPLWQEYSLYSDARIAGGTLDVGPYKFVTDWDQPISSRIGHPHRQLVFRDVDHFSDPGPDDRPDFTPNLAGWTGGDIGDQVASLLSLALARRVRSSGVSRARYDGITDELGAPRGPDIAPILGEPRGRPMLPRIAEEVRIEVAHPLLEVYGSVDAEDAVALLRAAGQYADALWWADADPRIAWIKLVGALETAANRVEDALESPPLDLLKRHRGLLYKELKDIDPRAADVAARHLHRLLGSESKMVKFTLAHAPKPPDVRPTVAQFGFATLEPALRKIYDWRSRDLHDGIPFPAPMCEAPMQDDRGVAHERAGYLAATSHGGTWEAKEDLPLYLHTFAYVVGGALRNWWRTLTDRRAVESPEV
jgi:hypothetical protein